ncbi:hypothetical protein CFK41_13390 [Brachybacterium ginsengisoli]|uniref:Uncharacterized protein n=1 Tax=Brachybacterium ginsengisoli TaxID=1331682 RepID=A0A291GZW5_9MICO|nr:hypothetical protein CFK41_13390 [Brachybacterium ginsengisoli]
MRGACAVARTARAEADDGMSPVRPIWGPKAVGDPPASAATGWSPWARSREGVKRSAGTASGESNEGSAEEVM